MRLDTIDVKSAPVPHTGEWCAGSGAKTFTKVTLKRIVDRTVSGLLQFSSHEPKFEASDVVRVGEQFYVVCDSSWSILRLDERLPLLSHDNQALHPDASFALAQDEKEESGFEVLMHDKTSGAFYVIRESVEHEEHETGAGSYYAAQVLKLSVGDSGYSVVESCSSEMRFEGTSKGFEGGAALRGVDGELYLLGLCEGNFCSEARGKQAGNGRVVVMARTDAPDAPGGCLWKTVATLALPQTANFVDYSALAIYHGTGSVAVTSQENSQLWVGTLVGGADGSFDPSAASFSDGAVYDFPRTTGSCEVQYCNIEGIHWVSVGGTEDEAPGTLVAVSDKMKSKGRQPASCQDKDQGVHLFALP